MQTGAQLTAGFLLTLPFTSTFGRLTDLQRDLYLALVLIAAVTTVLVLAPVAAHRRLSGEGSRSAWSPPRTSSSPPCWCWSRRWWWGWSC